MVPILTQGLFVGGIVGLLIACWRLSKRPNWRTRVVVYGWAAIFLWALLWAVLMPMSLRGIVSPESLARYFPDGIVAAGALCTGWFWPLIIVLIGRRRGGDSSERDHAL